MIPPDFFLFLHQQRHQEMVRQTEQALRAEGLQRKVNRR
jgi:hypothetical protein